MAWIELDEAHGHGRLRLQTAHIVAVRKPRGLAPDGTGAEIEVSSGTLYYVRQPYDDVCRDLEARDGAPTP